MVNLTREQNVYKINALAIYFSVFMEIIREVAQAFVAWTKLKIKIHFEVNKFYPRERQVWWVSMGQNVGVEINGKNNNFERPVLVLKRFNDEACLVVPLSSRIKKGIYYAGFKNRRGQMITGSLSQVRCVSTKRFIRKIEKISPEDFIRIKSAFVSAI